MVGGIITTRMDYELPWHEKKLKPKKPRIRAMDAHTEKERLAISDVG